MIIEQVGVEAGYKLRVIAADGEEGVFDVSPYLDAPAFKPLKQPSEFAKVISNRYFVSWACGADLSADTIEAHWQQ